MGDFWLPGQVLSPSPDGILFLLGCETKPQTGAGTHPTPGPPPRGCFGKGARGWMVPGGIWGRVGAWGGLHSGVFGVVVTPVLSFPPQSLPSRGFGTPWGRSRTTGMLWTPGSPPPLGSVGPRGHGDDPHAPSPMQQTSRCPPPAPSPMGVSQGRCQHPGGSPCPPAPPPDLFMGPSAPGTKRIWSLVGSGPGGCGGQHHSGAGCPAVPLSIPLSVPLSVRPPAPCSRCPPSPCPSSPRSPSPFAPFPTFPFISF